MHASCAARCGRMHAILNVAGTAGKGKAFRLILQPVSPHWDASSQASRCLIKQDVEICVSQCRAAGALLQAHEIEALVQRFWV